MRLRGIIMDKIFDFETAKTVSQVPALQRLKIAHQSNQEGNLSDFFDSDVQRAIKEHDTPQDRARLNAVIRALYLTA